MSLLSLKASLLIMGLGGIIAQILLLRELLVSFFGNELTIGIILANWLILEAIGSFLIGRSVEKTKWPLELYVCLQLIFSIALPLAIFLTRIFNNIIFAVPGEGLGFATIIYASFFILLPVAISHGALFTYGCKLYSRSHEENAVTVGKVYILETIGSIAGGILITFVLIQYLNSFEIALGISVINAVISLFLLPARPVTPSVNLRNFLWGLSLLLAFGYFGLLFTGQARGIHLMSIKSQWQGLDLIHHENSIYGNIAITKSGEQYTFYTDGIPAITTPYPDIARAEDLVHFPLLSHPGPKSVLILSGGAGGILSEILKYPVTRVSYVELDPLLLKLIRQFPTPLTEAELADPRVKIHFTDSRLFVAKTHERFDIIFIGLPLPQELQTNRLFSAEFFSAAKIKLNPGGIIVLSLPGSFNYLSPELKDLNSCILNTLKSVYRQVRIIPGDTNLYLASDSAQLMKVTPGELGRRLAERGIKTSLFTKEYIEYRLHDRWLSWFLPRMEGSELNINSDFRPVGVYYSLSYLNSLFSPYLAGVFKWFEGIGLNFYIALTFIATLLLAAIFVIKPGCSRYSVPYAIFTSGFASMILDLAIIFTFQTLYGYLYFQIGLLVTIFMAGAALGSIYITRRLEGLRQDSRLFLFTEIFVIAFALLLPFIFSIPSGHIEKPAVYISLYAAFILMSFLCGAQVGFQFPLAGKVYLGASPQGRGFGEAAGLIYGADLLGGFIGGFLGGVILLPLLGLTETCFLVAVIKISSLLLFLLFTRIRK